MGDQSISQSVNSRLGIGDWVTSRPFSSLLLKFFSSLLFLCVLCALAVFLFSSLRAFVPSWLISSFFFLCALRGYSLSARGNWVLPAAPWAFRETPLQNHPSRPRLGRPRLGRAFPSLAVFPSFLFLRAFVPSWLFSFFAPNFFFLPYRIDASIINTTAIVSSKKSARLIKINTRAVRRSPECARRSCASWVISSIHSGTFTSPGAAMIF